MPLIGLSKPVKWRILQNARGIREIFSILWSADKKLTLLLILTNIRTLTWPIQAIAAKGIVDIIVITSKNGLDGSAKTRLFYLFALYFVPFAINRIWWPVNSYVRALMLARVSTEVKNRIMSAMSSARLEFFDHPESSDLLKNALEQTDGRRPINVVNNIFNFLAIIVSFLVASVPMFKINAVLTILLILSAIPGIILENRFSKARYKFESDTARQKRKIDYAYKLFTSKKTAKEVRQLNISDYIAEKHATELKGYQKAFIALQNRKFALDIPAWAVTQAIALGGYYVMMAGVSKGSLQLGDLSFFIMIVRQIQSSIQDIGGAYNNTADSGRYMNNLLKLYSNPYPDPIGGESLPTGSIVTIKFENVSFKYPGANDFALENVSFEISLPQHIAIVGLNGSGKTTLIKLLLRLYDPLEGHILFSGVDIRNIDIIQWRKLFTVCFQDAIPYGFSLRESIALSQLTANEPEILEAAEKAGLSSVIENFPYGLDTCLLKEFDTNASELSGGQYSRVALARAFLGQGKIVILDEPTAALDAKAERDVFNKFNTLEKDRLGIMVTHRLSSTVAADKILVFEKGRLIECGIHVELISKGGTYAKLFTMQAKAYLEAAV